jgi:hypothetical protein
MRRELDDIIARDIKNFQIWELQKRFRYTEEI